MTLPDVVVDVPFPLQQLQQQPQGRDDDGETTCSDLQQSGVVGRISSIECPLVQPFVQDTCGCVSLSTTSPDEHAAEPPQQQPYIDVFSIPSSADGGSSNGLRSQNYRDLLCRSAFIVILLVIVEGAP